MRKYKSFTAILLTTAIVTSLAGCSQNAAQIDSSVEASESTSGISSSGNDIETTEAEKAEETMAASSEEETEESTAAAETSGTEATAEEQSETEETSDEATSEDASEETTKETTTKSSETTKAPRTTKASETTKAAVKPQSLAASVSGTHYVGDTLTGADFAVTVTMSDGSTLTNPAGWSANPLVLSSTSNQITVAYEGVSTTITVKASERPAATTSVQPSETATTAAQIATTADPHVGMVLANDGQWHETKADGEELHAGDVMWFNGEWVVLPENFGQGSGNYRDNICADRDWSYDIARRIFDAENAARAEAGAPPLIWSDELYEVAKQCAKVCGDAGRIDHDFTNPYRKYTYVTNSGYVLDYWYDENLGYVSIGGDDEAHIEWGVECFIDGIKNSSGHYESLIKNSGFNEEGSVAVYRKGDEFYVSCLFHHIDYDLDEIENY